LEIPKTSEIDCLRVTFT